MAYEEFPRVVYGPKGKTLTIRSEDERPDGYFNTVEEAELGHGLQDDRAAAEEAAKAAADREQAKAALDAEGVKHSPNAHTATLQKRVEEVASEKDEFKAFLDEHDVEYAADLNHAGLAELAEKLNAHLKEQEAAAAQNAAQNAAQG